MAGGQSAPPPPLRGSDASSSPLKLDSVGTAPACDRQLHADLDQASNLPLPPSPDTPPLSESAPTNAPDSIPKIVIDLAAPAAPAAPITAPSKPASAAAAAPSPSMAPVSHPSSLTACLQASAPTRASMQTTQLSPRAEYRPLTQRRHSRRQMAPKKTWVRPVAQQASPRPWLVTDGSAGKIYSISGLVPTKFDCATPQRWLTATL